METSGNIGFMILGAVVVLIFSFVRFILHEEWIWVPKAQNYGPTWYFILMGVLIFGCGLIGLLRQKKQ